MKIAREALPFAVGLLVLCAAGWFVHPWVSALPLALLAFVLWFFRDPERTPPADPSLLISPADGKIIQNGPRTISVFMNVFNVHVCRAPTDGTVESVAHSPGRFLAAFKDEAPEQNERTAIVLREGAAEHEFVLIAGLVARRIVCKVRPGQRLAQGDRVGLIRFGSRVDVALPAGAQVQVAIGDRVRAGETVLASLAAK